MRRIVKVEKSVVEGDSNDAIVTYDDGTTARDKYTRAVSEKVHVEHIKALNDGFDALITAIGDNADLLTQVQALRALCIPHARGNGQSSTVTCKQALISWIGYEPIRNADIPLWHIAIVGDKGERAVKGQDRKAFILACDDLKIASDADIKKKAAALMKKYPGLLITIDTDKAATAVTALPDSYE